MIFVSPYCVSGTKGYSQFFLCEASKRVICLFLVFWFQLILWKWGKTPGSARVCLVMLGVELFKYFIKTQLITSTPSKPQATSELNFISWCHRLPGVCGHLAGCGCGWVVVSHVAVWGRAELCGWSSGRGQFVVYRFWNYCLFRRCRSFFDF